MLPLYREATYQEDDIGSRTTSSYRRILTSTALIGGTQIVKIFLGIIRTKVLATLLGPSGIGIADLYQSATGLTGAVAGFGIGTAGVRQIAEAVGTVNEEKIARTVRTLRITSLVSGLLGTLATLALCRQISYTTFGNYSHTFGIALMSLTLVFGQVSAGQAALLQGLRYLKDLASCQVLGVIFGTVVAITLVYFFRERGIAPYLVAVSAFGTLSSWWYARRVKVQQIKITFRDIALEARGLLNMGFAFMVTGLLVSGTDYVSRVLITRQLGMDAVGLYSATWTLSSLYVGVILGAMGADFYPRLTAVAADDDTVNQLVNEQTEMGILIGIPGILATLALAPLVLRVLYSEAFMPAAELIRWQVLGVALRVVCFPMGFIQLAKAMSKLYILTETAFAAVNISVLFLCIKVWGLEGAGISFLILYVIQTVSTLCVCNLVTGFCWSKKAVLFILLSTCLAGTQFVMLRLLPGATGTILGLVLTAAVSIGCLFELQRMLKLDLRRYIPSGANWG